MLSATWAMSIGALATALPRTVTVLGCCQSVAVNVSVCGSTVSLAASVGAGEIMTAAVGCEPSLTV